MNNFPEFLFLALSICVSAISIVFLFKVRPRIRSSAQLDTLNAFSTAVEARTGNKGELTQIIELAMKVSAQLGLDLHQVRNLEQSIHLCDIGMSAIPFDCLQTQSKGHLTESQRKELDRHPEISAAMVSLVPSFAHLAEIVRCHHASFEPVVESYLPSGDEIPIEARIISVCSTYIRTERSHGSILAREMLFEQSGKQFCPDCVNALFSLNNSKKEFDQHSTVQTECL